MSLSFGTVAARGLAAVSQFLLIVWLSPAEFGYWAAAVSSVTLISAFSNFGLVQGYLAGNARSAITPRQLRRESVAINALLAVLGLVIAAAYTLNGQPYIAMLAAIAALTIPISGASFVEHAFRLQRKNVRRIVVVQMCAAVAKLLVGIAIAILTESALALAVSQFVFAACNYLMLRVKILPVPQTAADSAATLPKRLTWAVNKVSIQLPLYGAIFIAQFLTTPEVLGIYFLANSAVLALSSLVAPILGKISLTAMAGMDPRSKLQLALRLANPISASIALFASVAGLIAPVLNGVLSNAWQSALIPLVVLFAALPSRMTTPILDAVQQSSDRWWASTGFYVIDGIGTCVVALVAVYDDPMLLALAVASWRTIMGILRVILLLPGRDSGKIALVAMPLLVYLAISGGAIWDQALLALLACGLAVIWLFLFSPAMPALFRRIGSFRFKSEEG